MCFYASVSCSTVSNSVWPHGLYPARLLCPWNSPGKNTGVGCHSLFQGIFPTQRSNPGLLHCRWILYYLSHQGSPTQSICIYVFVYMWKILKEMGIPDHLICLLRNLYVGQKATLRTGHGTTDWFQIGKGVWQGWILSPCLFNLYAEYIMRSAGLEEAQAAIKIARRNINNLRYAEDTTLMSESEEELKSLLMKVKEESEKLA